MTRTTNDLAAAAASTDPTRRTRISQAAGLLANIPTSLSMAAMFAETSRILASCGLMIRTDMHDSRITPDEAGGAAISVDVSFALAAAGDGPRAELEYTRVRLTGRTKPDMTPSVRHQVQILAAARRQWLTELAAATT